MINLASTSSKNQNCCLNVYSTAVYLDGKHKRDYDSGMSELQQDLDICPLFIPESDEASEAAEKLANLQEEYFETLGRWALGNSSDRPEYIPSELKPYEKAAYETAMTIVSDPSLAIHRQSGLLADLCLELDSERVGFLNSLGLKAQFKKYPESQSEVSDVFEEEIVGQFMANNKPEVTGAFFMKYYAHIYNMDLESISEYHERARQHNQAIVVKEANPDPDFSGHIENKPIAILLTSIAVGLAIAGSLRSLFERKET